MPFVKGDPHINRNGRPKNAEPELLRTALEKEGVKKGITFWEKVAEYAFRDRQVMIAVIKKFVPDTSEVKVEGDGLGTKVQNFILVRSNKSKEENADSRDRTGKGQEINSAPR